jgi:hypothetical protein
MFSFDQVRGIYNDHYGRSRGGVTTECGIDSEGRAQGYHEKCCWWELVGYFCRLGFFPTLIETTLEQVTVEVLRSTYDAAKLCSRVSLVGVESF